MRSVYFEVGRISINYRASVLSVLVQFIPLRLNLSAACVWKALLSLEMGKARCSYWINRSTYVWTPLFNSYGKSIQSGFTIKFITIQIWQSHSTHRLLGTGWEFHVRGPRRISSVGSISHAGDTVRKAGLAHKENYCSRADDAPETSTERTRSTWSVQSRNMG